MKLLRADLFDALPALDAESFDAICTDPPYGLEFMGKEWDRPWAVGAEQPVGYDGRDDLTLPSHRDGRNANCRRCGGRARGANRCRCKEPLWDRAPGSDLREYQAWCERWAAECFRLLKPGGHLLAFGGTRTYHRLAAGIEDAGFEIRDCIAWMYGSGFPKSLDVSKAIDRAAGAEREVIGSAQGAGSQNTESLGPYSSEYDATVAATEEARAWEGWGTALKPAFEPIVVARKPLVGTVAANVLEHGTGALNIDGCRIPTDESWSSDGEPPKPREVGIGFSSSSSSSSHDLGRWPANVALDEEAAAMLDEQTGELVSNSGEPFKRNTDKFRTAYGAFAGTEQEQGFYGDRGGASRFFYCAKVSRAERNAGLDGFEAPSPDVTTLNPTRPVCNVCGCGTLVAGPGKRLSCGHDDYRFEPSEGGKRGEKDPARNHHPTVKPVALMRWLVRLVTPPGGRVLDPFLGSGTTGIAAALEGFRFAGVERDPGYFAIADARIRFWSEHGEQALTVVADGERAERRRRETADSGQLDLLS